ncbi:MAG: acyltransferase [Synergistaceae bacterium]|nr:acyltransferase [Synergistaceae bacterium]
MIAHRTSHIAHRTSPNHISSSGRIQEIDSLRGFAIFLVVLGHAIILFPVNLKENFYCGILFDIIYSFHMPLMFVISGFCWTFTDYVASVRKKFFRLVIPYAVFNVIDMLPRQILSSLVRRPKPFSESLMKTLLYGGEFWFLYTLFIIFMIYPLIFRVSGSSKRKMMIVAVILCALSWFLGRRGGVFMIGRAAYYMFFFHLGVMARQFYCREGKLPDIKFPAIALALTSALWMLLLFKIKIFPILTILAGITASYIMTSYSSFNNAFSRFGKYSLQIYLLNGITLGISRAIICNVLHVYNPFIIVAFNVFIDFFVSYAFIRYVCEKNKITRFIMGM